MGKTLAMVMGGAEITRDVDPLETGTTIEVTFDPTALPADFSIYDVESAEEMAEIVCQVVVDWDMVGPFPYTEFRGMKAGELVAAGDPIPVDPAIVAKMPAPFLIALIQSLTAASYPKARTRNQESPETPSESPAPGTSGASTASSSKKAARNRSRST